MREGLTLRAGITKPEPVLRRVAGHHRDWIDACKGGEAASSHFEYGARLTEFALVGVLALRMRKPIEWNAENLRATGLAAADPVIHGAFRPGCELV